MTSRTFVFYDPGDGPRPILRVRRCPPENVRLGVPEGLAHVEVDVSSLMGITQTHLLDLSGPVPVLVEKPAPVDTRTAEEIKADALARIDAQAAAERRELAGVNDDIHAAKLAEARFVMLAAALLGDPPVVPPSRGDGGTDAPLPGGWEGVLDTPLLDAEAAAAGVTVATVAAAVIAKNRASAQAIAAIEVKRQAAQAAVRKT